MAGTTSFLLTMVLVPYNITTMEREIKDLQKLIEDRASKKLTEDIKAFAKTINASPCLSSGWGDINGLLKLQLTRNEGTPNQRQDKIGVLDLFSTSNYDSSIQGDFLKALYRHLLPTYITRESAEFLKKVDQVVEDVQNLLDNTQTGL